MSRNAAQKLVDVLIAQGVERVFCVPGESYLSVLDALYEARGRIETIVCRHEAAAANMAEATGKLTGRPGVAFVTRGPGACHAGIGVHTAQQDSSPMILFIGQIARGDREREAFQEVDYRAFFGPMTKWTAEIDEAERVPELVERAFHVAMQGRMGPVALALPEDMLVEAADACVSARVEPVRSAPDADAIARVGAILATVELPMLVLGGSGWNGIGLAGLDAFLSKTRIPAALSFRRKDILSNDHDCYVGDLGLGTNPKLLARLKSADLVIALGARLGENPSQGYTLFSREESVAKLVHIHPDPVELGRVWPVRVGLCADVNLAAQALAGLDVGKSFDAWRVDARTDYEKFSAPIEVPAAVNLSHVFAYLNEALPADAIVANDAGNFAAWLHRFYRHRAPHTQLGPTSGAMGYSLPAAIAAKLQWPERDVLCVVGDGGFMMNGNELATCVRHGVNVITLVVDNSGYGTIRMHQERNYPTRVHGTELSNPDFVTYARSFGVQAERVERTEDFPTALQRARDANAPALLHIVADMEQIAPGQSVSALRAQNAQR